MPKATVADAEVSDRLYQRAMGFVAPDIDIRVIENRIVETPLEKYYPPDTTAAIFWLKNRQKDKWRDKQEVEHTGEVNLIQRIQEARKRARGE